MSELTPKNLNTLVANPAASGRAGTALTEVARDSPILGTSSPSSNPRHRAGRGIGSRPGPGAATVVLAAYGIGMGAVMMTLALLAGGARDRLIKTLRRALPRMQRISGALLLVAGAYLSYYWLRILFGPVATLGDDPIVGTVQRFTTRIERIATANASMILTMSVASVAAVAGHIAWRSWRSKQQLPGDGDGSGDAGSQSLPQRVDAGRS
jgi:hypothetical protein